MRILVAGGPRAGKTTLGRSLAKEQGVDLQSTDDLAEGRSFTEQSEAAAKWMRSAGPWVIEGVTIPRALRKWLARNPEGKPADVVYWRAEPFVDLSPGQSSLAKGTETVWREVLPELQARGVEIR